MRPEKVDLVRAQEAPDILNVNVAERLGDERPAPVGVAARAMLGLGRALIEGADALVSLHRAEGLGYHILEAMMLGVPVIATAYSGNVDFCSESTSFLTPYRLVPVKPHQYPFVKGAQVWAEPDEAGAVERMRRVYTDETARNSAVVAARALIESKFSMCAFASNLKARLDALTAEREPDSKI